MFNKHQTSTDPFITMSLGLRCKMNRWEYLNISIGWIQKTSSSISENIWEKIFHLIWGILLDLGKRCLPNVEGQLMLSRCGRMVIVPVFQPEDWGLIPRRVETLGRVSVNHSLTAPRCKIGTSKCGEDKIMC